MSARGCGGGRRGPGRRGRPACLLKGLHERLYPPNCHSLQRRKPHWTTLPVGLCGTHAQRRARVFTICEFCFISFSFHGNLGVKDGHWTNPLEFPVAPTRGNQCHIVTSARAFFLQLRPHNTITNAPAGV